MYVEPAWYCPVIVGHTREQCAEALGPDAFKLTAERIINRLHDRGYAPDVHHPSREALPIPGTTTMIYNAGREFLVSIDEAAELVAVQEVCLRPYPNE